jgi:hypothetical protein
MAKPLVNKTYKMQRTATVKGSWTYVIISEIPRSERGRGGFVRVKGSVDGVEIKDINLFPLKDGRMFFPIKAEIRKKIKKEAGDTVKIVLYRFAEPAYSSQRLPKELRL